MPRVKNNLIFKALKQTLYLFILVPFLTQCQSKQSVSNDSITVAIASAPKTLDPRFATDAYGQRISKLIFQSLVSVGPKLNIQGDAATEWSYKNLVYTFYLKNNLTFSNNKPVTDKDILFSFDTYRSTKSPFHGAFKVIKKVESHLKAEKPNVKIYLNKFQATLLLDLTLVKILPKDEVEKHGDSFFQHLIGSGPFKVTKISSSQIELEKRDTIDSNIKINKVIFKVIKDDSTRYLKMRKGNIDIAQAEIPKTKISEFSKNPDFKVFKYPSLSMNYILVNLQDKNLKKLKLRKAISESIDRESIIKYKLENLASIATSILTPNNSYFESFKPSTISYLPEKSKKTIKELFPNGLKLTLKTSNTNEVVEIGKVLANQLKDVGITIDLQSYEWGTFYEDIKKGRFQLATLRWVGATDPDIYRTALHSKEFPPGRNRGKYSNPALDKLLDLGIKEDDLKKRHAIYKNVQKIVLNDLPIIPLWYLTDTAVIHKRVKGYSPPQNGDYSFLYHVHK